MDFKFNMKFSKFKTNINSLLKELTAKWALLNLLFYLSDFTQLKKSIFVYISVLNTTNILNIQIYNTYKNLFQIIFLYFDLREKHSIAAASVNAMINRPFYRNPSVSGNILNQVNVL